MDKFERALLYAKPLAKRKRHDGRLGKMRYGKVVRTAKGRKFQSTVEVEYSIKHRDASRMEQNAMDSATVREVKKHLIIKGRRPLVDWSPEDVEREVLGKMK